MSSLTNGLAYTFRVRAVGNNGIVGPPSDVVRATPRAGRVTRAAAAGGLTVIGADPGTLDITGDRITATVGGTGVGLTLPSAHGVTRVTFSRPPRAAVPAPQAGVTFGAAAAYVNVELDPPLPSASPATVCLHRPAGLSGHAAVYHLAEQGREWEALAGAGPEHQARRPGDICSSLRSGSPVVVGTRTVEGATHTRDADPLGVTLSDTRVTVTEASGAGRTATYTVGLTAQPSSAVTITPTSGEPGVATITPSSITFTPATWDTAQAVTVTGVDDRVDADRRTTITHTVTGGGYDAVRIPDVAVTLTDDDTVAARLFGFAGDTLTVTEADGAMHRTYYQIVLQSQPTGAVTIIPTSGKTGVATVTPSSITFTADTWAEPQSLAVTGVDDHVDGGDRRTTITHTVSGGGYDAVRIPDVAVTLTDDDVAGITVTETDGHTVTTEGGSRDSVSVVLDSQPTAEVTLTVSSSDVSEGTVDTSRLVFTPHNWATAQVITVTGVDDRLDDGEQSYKIELGIAASRDSHYNGLKPDDVVVTSTGAFFVALTGVVLGTTKIEGYTITTQVDGAGVQLTLPAGVTFGAEPASLEIRLDAPLASAATVCLQQPAGLSGTLFVYHLADKAQTWEKLSPAAAPRGYVCGETGSFSVFVVGSPLPGFGAASIEEYNWTVGEAVDVRLPAATGGDGPITYRLSPALPAGLSFEAKARTITGTPTEAVAKTRFTDTATDADGQTGQLHFRVTVQAAEVTHRSRALTVALAAFGRTAATEAVAVIGRRFGAPPVGKPAVTVGGTAVPALDIRSVAGVLGGVLGLTGASRDSAGRGRAAEGRVAPSRSPRLAATDVFARSEFAVPLTRTNEGELTTGWTFWGTGAASGFSSQLLETDGAVYTGYVGLDYRFGQKGLAGVAVSHSVGGLDYEVAGDFLLVSGERGGIRGEVDLAMTSVLPYVHYTPSPGLGLWGLAGAGVGELEVQDAAGRVETDVQLLLAAVGGRQALTTWHGIEVAVKSDAFAVRVKADEAAGLAAVTGVAHRARVALAMKTDVALSPESALQPSVELGGRWDNGDAETGMGAELSGGVEYQQRWWGVSLAARGRYLLAHQATDFEAWGGSLAVKVGEGLGGQGLWVAFEPTWGTPASGVEQLWGREAGPAGNGAPAGGAVGRLTADVGYGLALRQPGWLVTPYGGVATGPATSRYRLGGHLQVHEAMALSLEGIQQTTLDSATEHGIVFSWTVGL